MKLIWYVKIIIMDRVTLGTWLNNMSRVTSPINNNNLASIRGHKEPLWELWHPVPFIKGPGRSLAHLGCYVGTQPLSSCGPSVPCELLQPHLALVRDPLRTLF